MPRQAAVKLASTEKEGVSGQAVKQYARVFGEQRHVTR